MKTVWKKLPGAAKVALLVGLATIAATLVVKARRDLAARDPSRIRGNPEVWDKVTRLPGGATAYLVAGRRPESNTA